jgi:hypothetical protein
VCPRRVLLFSIPVFGKGGLAEEGRFVGIGRLVCQDRHQSAVASIKLNGFEQMDCAPFVNNGFESLNHGGSIPP